MVYLLPLGMTPYFGYVFNFISPPIYFPFHHLCPLSLSKTTSPGGIDSKGKMIQFQTWSSCPLEMGQVHFEGTLWFLTPAGLLTHCVPSGTLSWPQFPHL